MSWQIINKVAQLEHPSWSGIFDLNKPDQGLILVPTVSGILQSPDYDDAGIRLFKVALPNVDSSVRLGDFYSRGEDITIQYPADDYRNFNIQLDLRVIRQTDDVLVVEFWLSIQTHLLDSRPSVKINFELPAMPTKTIFSDEEMTQSESDTELTEDKQVPAGLIAETTIGGPYVSSSLFIHPLDQRDICWMHSQEGDSDVEIEWFGQFMEKGVIRRGRMQVVLSQKPMTMEYFRALYKDFAGSPLPLTV